MVNINIIKTKRNVCIRLRQLRIAKHQTNIISRFDFPFITLMYFKIQNFIYNFS